MIKSYTRHLLYEVLLYFQVGEFDELDSPICALIRLKEPMILPNVTEVPVPTRFIFFYLGPPVCMHT